MRGPREVVNVEAMVREALGKDAQTPKKADLSAQPKIVVVGVGGAGNNIINRIHQMGVKGAQLVAINTDRQHLTIISDDITKVLIGEGVTRGLGSGGSPEIGRKAAEVSRQTLQQILGGSDLVFVVAGMGGGTGTGAAPVVAQIAREAGALVISMVTYPFRLERARMEKADQGIMELAKTSDTVIVIDNNRLVELVPNLPMQDAFRLADTVIARTIQGITETITVPSLINLDYADLRSIMTSGGLSVISVGEGRGVNKVNDVVEDVLKNTLLDINTEGAKGVLIHITGGQDLTIGEANAIGELLTEKVDPNAQVILGARIDPNFEDMVQVIAIFTGVQSPYIKSPVASSQYSEVPNLEIDYLR